MRESDPPVRWLKAYWEEEDILFFFEADQDGFVIRQVELQGPSRKPIAAAALVELPRTEDGQEAMLRYRARSEGLVRVPESEPERRASRSP